MKGVFWNCNGLQDPTKPRFLFYSVTEHCLDFIALLETKRNDYNVIELGHYCANKNFLWEWNPPRGRSGDILVGINTDKFDVLDIKYGNFILKFKLHNKADNFEWHMVAVYGAAQESEKEIFLSELARMCDTENLPLLVGGDFNIIRNQSEKNNNRYNNRWPSLFNAVINSLDLRELELSGRQFTWANNLQVLTFEKLDRILISTDWELKFPRVTTQSLPRGISDHTPLLLDMGSPSQPNKCTFKFELAWLFKDGFHEKVAEVWQRETKGSNSLERWQNKIRSLRRYLRGWAKNMNGLYKKEKKEILGKLEQLDKKAECTLLLPHELNIKQCLNARLIQLLREEEIKWYQRSKSKRLLPGDNNTKYFHMVANGKHRKSQIFELSDGDHTTRGNDPLMSYITNYYKKLFGPSDSGHFSPEEDRRDDITQIHLRTMRNSHQFLQSKR
jgi:exonuclease III